jgi:hypothetical protein
MPWSLETLHPIVTVRRIRTFFDYMKKTNKEMAALLRDVASKIEHISDSEVGDREVLKQLERIPMRKETAAKFTKAFKDEFIRRVEAKKKKPSA